MSAKPVEIEIVLKDRVSTGLEGVTRHLEELLQKSGSTSERIALLESALGGLYRQLQTLRASGSSGSASTLSAIGQVESKIGELESRLESLRQVSESTPLFPPGAPAAVRQYNGLHASLQQIARELPTLAMGPQLFFMAISNNLPIFTDELARARREYEALVATGERATPVWRQVLSSLFSWQTALTTGIMLLVMYGERVVEWAGHLVKGSEALAQSRREAERFHAFRQELDKEWTRTTSENAGAQIAAYRRLQRQYGELSDSLDARRKFVEANQDAFHQLGFAVESVADAENLFVRHTDSVVAALTARARAAAYEQTITQAQQRYIEQTETARRTVSGGGYYRPISPGKYWSTGDLEREVSRLQEGVDYTRSASSSDGRSALSLISLTAAGAEKVNALRRDEAARRLAEQEAQARRELDQVVQSAVRGLEAQTKAAEQALAASGVQAYQPAADKAASQRSRQNAQQAERESRERLEAEEQGARALQELRRQNDQAYLEQMDEGLAARLARIRYDYQQQAAATRQAAQELAASNRAAGLTGLDADGLTREQQDELERSRQAATARRQREEQRALKEALSQFRGYYEQREDIIKEYDRRRRDMEQAGASRDALAELEHSRTEALASVDAEFARRQDDFQQWADAVAKLSLDRIDELLQEARRRLASVKLGERFGLQVDPAEAARARAEVERLDELMKQSRISPTKQDNEQWDDMVRLLGQVREALDEVGDTFGGLLGEMLSGLGQLAGDTLTAVKSFQQMRSAMDAGDTMDAAISGLSGVTAGLQLAGTVYQKLTEAFGADYSQYEAMSEQYERLSAVWDELIAKKREYLEQSWGAESTSAYDEAVELVRREQELARQVAQARASAGASAGSHSIGYRQDNWVVDYWRSEAARQAREEGGSALRLTEEQIRQQSASLYDIIPLVTTWDNVTGNLLSATGEQLQTVREELPELWSALDADFRSALEDIIACEEEIDNLGETLQASLTQVSFDTLYDSFLDQLMDMESTAEDFGSDLSERFMRAMLSERVGTLYRERLAQWYDQFAGDMGDGTLSSAELESLRQGYDAIVDEALALRDELAAATGYDQTAGSSGGGTTQQGRAGVYTAMTQEQGTRLEGLWTTSAMHLSSLDDRALDVSEQMGQAADSLRRIEAHTGSSARSLTDLLDEVRRLVRDGVKVR